MKKIIIISLMLLLSLNIACTSDEVIEEKINNVEEYESTAEERKTEEKPEESETEEKTNSSEEEKKSDESLTVVETDKVKEKDQSIIDPKLEEFNGLLNDINNYDKVIELLDRELPIIGEEIGQEMIDSFIEYRDTHLLPVIYEEFRDLNIKEKINTYYSNNIVSFLKYHDINAITDKELKNFVIKLRESHINPSSGEGDIYFDDDFTWHYRYSDYLSAEMQDYLDLMAVDISKKAFDDGAVIVPWDEIYNRQYMYEDFLKKYPDSKYKKELMFKHDLYFSAYLRGLDNTPAFDFNSKLNNELKNSYLEKIENGQDSAINKILTLYIPILEKNDYKKTKEIDDFLNGLFIKSDEPSYYFEDSSFKGGYGFFRKGDFYTIGRVKEMPQEKIDNLNISQSQINDMIELSENSLEDKRFALKTLENNILEVSIIDRVTDTVEYTKTFSLSGPSLEGKVSRYNTCIYIKIIDEDGNRLIKINETGEEKELYNGRYFSYMISPNEDYIAINEDERIKLLDRFGKVLYEYKDIFDFKNEAETLKLVGWSADSALLWIEKSYLTEIEDFYKINVKESKHYQYDVINLGIQCDYDLNVSNGKIAYSNYPILFDVSSIYELQNSNEKISLYIYDLETQTNYFACENIVKPFEPKWMNDNTLEYYSSSEYSRRIFEIEVSQDIFEALRDTTLGKLKLGMTDMEVVDELGECLDKEDLVIWDADGLEHQEWNYKDQGLNFDMIKQDDRQIVNSIYAISPFKERTNKDIGIGTTREDVLKAYEENIDLEETDDNRIIVGSIYGGIIFRIENGVVSSIYIGAGAE